VFSDFQKTDIMLVWTMAFNPLLRQDLKDAMGSAFALPTLLAFYRATGAVVTSEWTKESNSSVLTPNVKAASRRLTKSLTGGTFGPEACGVSVGICLAAAAVLLVVLVQKNVCHRRRLLPAAISSIYCESRLAVYRRLCH